MLLFPFRLSSGRPIRRSRGKCVSPRRENGNGYNDNIAPLRYGNNIRGGRTGSACRYGGLPQFPWRSPSPSSRGVCGDIPIVSHSPRLSRPLCNSACVFIFGAMQKRKTVPSAFACFFIHQTSYFFHTVIFLLTVEFLHECHNYE